tara:strand:+ start:448 stop:642 length:195 start_codon:yes stop_codon:yes gene_type:complete
MAVKDKIMINWINGFKAGNKKEKYQLEFRLGTFTVFELKMCLFCEEGCTAKRFRFMILNMGFEC